MAIAMKGLVAQEIVPLLSSCIHTSRSSTRQMPEQYELSIKKRGSHQRMRRHRGHCCVKEKTLVASSFHFP